MASPRSPPGNFTWGDLISRGATWFCHGLPCQNLDVLCQNVDCLCQNLNCYVKIGTCYVKCWTFMTNFGLLCQNLDFFDQNLDLFNEKQIMQQMHFEHGKTYFFEIRAYQNWNLGERRPTAVGWRPSADGPSAYGPSAYAPRSIYCTQSAHQKNVVLP